MATKETVHNIMDKSFDKAKIKEKLKLTLSAKKNDSCQRRGPMAVPTDARIFKGCSSASRPRRLPSPMRPQVLHKSTSIRSCTSTPSLSSPSQNRQTSFCTTPSPVLPLTNNSPFNIASCPATPHQESSILDSEEKTKSRPSSRSNSPTSPRKYYYNTHRSRPLSPSGSSGRRTPSPAGVVDPIAIETIQLRIKQVQKARLYLLRQPGPHSFLIAGDSPEHKYKVMIGPQTCTCGKGTHCIHILFVLLRVFKLGEHDSRLFLKSLKNFEIEELMQNYKLSVLNKWSIPSTSVQKDSTSSSKAISEDKIENGVDESSKEDGPICPICLLEMLEGESLVKCKLGCQNKLHHHCISIWAEECSRQNEPIICPLCRALWDVDSSLPNLLCKDGNKRPQPVKIPSSNLPVGHSHLGNVVTPKVGPMSALTQDKIKEWIEVFGPHIFNTLASRHWSVREKALYDILKLVCETSEKLKSDLPQFTVVIKVFSEIIATMMADPVYRVYVACLHSFHTVVTLISTANFGIEWVQETVQPMVSGILLKCSNGNKHTVELSISVLFEVAKGHTGAFAFQRNISSGVVAVGGLEFLMGCILTCTKGTVTWQWILGRLVVLERFLEELPEEFYLLYMPTYFHKDSNTKEESICKYKLVHLHRLMALIHFALENVNHPHATVNKLAKRVFLMASRLTVHIPSVFSQLYELILTLDSGLRLHLVHKLDVIAREFKNPDSHDPLHLECHLETKLSSDKSYLVADNEANTVVQKRNLAMELLNWRNYKSLISPAQSNYPVLPKQKSGRSSSCSPSSSPKKQPLRGSNEKSLLRCHSAHNIGVSDLVLFQSNFDQRNLKPPAAISGKMKKYKSRRQKVDSELVLPSKNFVHKFFSLQNNGDQLKNKCLFKSGAELKANNEEPFTEEESETKSHPSIPGLHNEPDDKFVIILQPDVENNLKRSPTESLSGEYTEGVHWLRSSLLGAGAFSSCYQAQDVKTGILMAVKQVSFCRSTPEEQEKEMEAIKEEILMMSKLRHPNILRILGATRHSGHYNVFSEWMAGGSVSALLDKYGAFTENVIARYTYQILSGLAYLHRHQIVHRDLKGANLLVDSTGQVLRIADFGTAVRLSSKRTVAGEFQGQLLGTIAFMAPEVLRGEDYGRACDIWSLGCVMIEMATRRPPWNANDVSNHLALIFKIACSMGPPQIPETLSVPIKDLLIQCLQVKAECRPSAIELLEHKCFLFQTI